MNINYMIIGLYDLIYDWLYKILLIYDYYKIINIWYYKY